MKLSSLFVLSAAVAIVGSAVAESKPRPNVLLIMSDDLNTDLGTYGHEIVKSPNIDALAAKGLQFNRAYCTATSCIPSRTAILTGQRPQTTGIYGPRPVETIRYRERFPDLVTMPQFFTKNGYRMIQIGKISDTRNDDPAIWGESYKSGLRFHEDFNKVKTPNAEEIQRRVDEDRGFYTYWAPVDSPDDALGDVEMANDAVKLLGELAKDSEQPFFLGVGFKSPHVDYSAPRRFFEMYDLEAMPDKGDHNDQVPPREQWDIGKENVFNGPQQVFVHTDVQAGAQRAYYACVSFLDEQVGKVLQALKDNGLEENTIVILASDHGHFLAERAQWGKSSFYEEVWRIPFVVVAPGVTKPGTQTDSFVELFDLYPTIAELCGLEVPDTVEAVSFVPVLKNPEAEVRDVVFGVNNQGWDFVRDERWKLAVGPDGQRGVLFDLENDPDETNNLFGKPETQEIQAELQARIDAIKPS